MIKILFFFLSNDWLVRKQKEKYSEIMNHLGVMILIIHPVELTLNFITELPCYLEEMWIGFEWSEFDMAIWNHMKWLLQNELKQDSHRKEGEYKLSFCRYKIIFFLITLRYNWHTTLCKSKMYNVLIWCTFIEVWWPI